MNAAAEYELTGFSEEIPRIFEVSDTLVEIEDFVYEPESGQVVFQDESLGMPGHYVVGGTSSWLGPSES